MLIKYGEGLEFEQDEQATNASPEPIPNPLAQEEALAEIMRHGFRAPVLGNEAVSVRLQGEEYGVYNVAARGIGIFLTGSEGYTIGSELPIVELTMFGKTFLLAGKVVHLSQDTTGPWLCGIEFAVMTPEVEKEFLRYLEKSRSHLFTGLARSGEGK